MRRLLAGSLVMLGLVSLRSSRGSRGHPRSARSDAVARCRRSALGSCSLLGLSPPEWWSSWRATDLVSWQWQSIRRRSVQRAHRTRLAAHGAFPGCWCGHPRAAHRCPARLGRDRVARCSDRVVPVGVRRIMVVLQPTPWSTATDAGTRRARGVVFDRRCMPNRGHRDRGALGLTKHGPFRGR